ncbi:MAG: GtrA family protein [Flavobacteriia bacterium]|nr:GtrA family protein [Flavobacteriia bacterium]NCT60961.1 GtrA family protein [Flavobacteriia bacterium]
MKFTLIGIFAVFVDLIFYYTFLNVLPKDSSLIIKNEEISKALSFLCGMTFSYFLNKFWTWKKKDRSKRRVAKFALIYGISLLVNVTVNSVLIFLLHNYKYLIDLPNKYLIAFLGATCVSALINFAGQKFWVFKAEKN